MGREIVGDDEKAMAWFAVKKEFDVKNPLVFHNIAVGSGQGGVAVDLRADEAAAFEFLKIGGR